MDKLAKMPLSTIGYRRSRALSQIAIPRYPARHEEQGMPGMPTATEKYGPNQEIYRTRRSATIFEFPPLGDWGQEVRFKSAARLESAGQRPRPECVWVQYRTGRGHPEAGPGCPTPADWAPFAGQILSKLIRL